MHRMCHPRLTTQLAVLALCVFSAPATSEAQSNLRLSGGAIGSITGCRLGAPLNVVGFSGTIQGQESCVFSGNFGTGSGNYAARAGNGEVGARSAAAVTAPFVGFGFPGGVSALAEYRTTVTITGPGPQVALRLRSEVDAVVLAEVNRGGVFSGGLSGSIGLAGFDVREEITVGFEFDRAPVVSRQGFNLFGMPTFTAGGVTFSSGIVESPLFAVSTNVALDFAMSFGARAVAVAGGQFDGEGLATGRADGLNTMTLPSTGFVFALPEGYSAFSADGAIVNNRWAFAPTQPVVPEPGSVVLLGIGLVGLLIARRRPTGAERPLRGPVT